MEALFENRYVRNKQFYKEFYRYTNFGRKFLIIGHIVFVLCFLLNLFRLFYNGEENTFLLIFIPSYFLVRFYSYFASIKYGLKRDLEILGREPTFEMYITDEHICIGPFESAAGKIELSKIKYATKTKNYIILASESKLFYSLSRYGFTKGTELEFINFLLSKGIKVS